MAASTATAAMGTAAAGAIIASGHHPVQPPQQLVVAPAANVTVEAPSLHSVPVHQSAWVTVKSGDTLSGIASDNCSTEADWTGIYAKNEKTIGGNPDVIQPDQQLAVDCRVVNIPAVTTAGYVQPQVHRQYHRGLAVRPAASGGYSVSSGFQACVIRAESGGNPGIWNASGHWGLYQFSASTWAGHGGNPADFGHASAAEQTQVFWNTVRADGTSDWAPYDGC